MTRERDLLTKQIFPELKRIALERRVEFTAVDLRWGVTEEEARQGRVVQICLEEINRCKPFFIGFFGERYGWAPSVDDVDNYEELIKDFPIVHKSIERRRSVTEMEIVHGVLESGNKVEAAFYQRAYSLTERFAEDHRADYFDKDEEASAKLLKLKRRVRESAHPVRVYDELHVFGQQVFADLSATLDRLFPESEVKSELEATRLEHRAYAEERASRYLPQQASLDQLDDYLMRIQSREVGERITPLVIGGASGLGKSALLSYWLTQLPSKAPNLTVIEHFPGVSGDATPRSLLTRFIREVRGISHGAGTHGISEIDSYGTEDRDALPSTVRELSDLLVIELAYLPTDQTVLIVLDALNQVSADTLSWLPRVFPPHVSFITSALPSKTYDELIQRGYETFDVLPLSHTDRAQLVVSYLGHFRKKLNASQVKTLADAPSCANPLFLTTILAELQLFGSFELLDQRIATLLSAENPRSLFGLILQRFEADYGEELTQACLSALYAARRGLTEDELIAYLEMPRLSLTPLLYSIERHLLNKDGLYTFGHDFLRQAVEYRYLALSAPKIHAYSELADWFMDREVNARKADELPWLLQASSRSDDLVEALIDLELIAYVDDKYEILKYWMNSGHPEQMRNLYTSKLEGIEAGETYSHKSMYGFLKLLDIAGLYHEALRIKIEMYERNKSTDLESKSEFARLYDKCSMYDNSMAIYNEIKPLSLFANNPSHFNLSLVSNFISALVSNGLYQDALSICEKLDSSSTVTYDEFKDAYLAFYTQYAGLLALLYRSSESTSILRKLHTLYVRDYSLNHPLTIQLTGTLCSSLIKVGQIKESRSLLGPAIDCADNTLGIKHPYSIKLREVLCGTLQSSKDSDQLCTLLSDILHSYSETLGDHHSITHTAKNNLATHFFNSNNFEKALKQYREVVSSYEVSLGLNHTNTLVARFNIASCLYKMGDLTESQKMMTDVYQKLVESIGPSHPYSLKSLIELTKVNIDIQEYKLAELYLMDMYSVIMEYKVEVQSIYWPMIKDAIQSSMRLNLEHLALDMISYIMTFIIDKVSYRDKKLKSRLSFIRKTFKILNPTSVRETLINIDTKINQSEPALENNLKVRLRNFICLEQLTYGLFHEAETSLRQVLDYSSESGQKVIYGNLGWALLLQGKESESYFHTSISLDHTPDQWQYHWRRLGLALSQYLKSGEDEIALGYLEQLRTILGADHERVIMAEERFKVVRGFFV